MICLIGVSYVGCNRTLAVILMTIGVTCIGGMYSGFLSNHIDIAPNFAGTLVAITNCAATIPGFVVPIFVGKLTHGNVNIYNKILLTMINRILLILLLYNFSIANYRSMENYIFRNCCLVYNRDTSLYYFRKRRRTALEQN